MYQVIQGYNEILWLVLYVECVFSKNKKDTTGKFLEIMYIFKKC